MEKCLYNVQSSWEKTGEVLLTFLLTVLERQWCFLHLNLAVTSADHTEDRLKPSSSVLITCQWHFHQYNKKNSPFLTNNSDRRTGIPNSLDKRVENPTNI